jgi:hypothetical protein
MVLANFEGYCSRRTLLLYGCFCEPGSWEHMRLFTQDYGLKETVSIVLEPSS